MSNIGKIIGNIFIGIIVTSVILLEFWGIYYSFHRYGTKDGFISVVVPPYAWYNGLSYLWQDPLWKDNYYSNTQNIAVLLEYSYNGNIKKDKQLQNMEKNTKKWLYKIPKKERQHLKENAKDYVAALIAYYEKFAAELKGRLKNNPLKSYYVQKHVNDFKDIKGFKTIWTKFNVKRNEAFRRFHQRLNDMSNHKYSKFKNKVLSAQSYIKQQQNISNERLRAELQILFRQ
jgi:hypothetical protein